MSDLVFFFGRFHVLALHLPIGILLLTVMLDYLSRSAKYQNLSPVIPVCWAATAITAIFTVVLGLMHITEGGFDGPSASAHRNYGIGVAVVSLAIWLLAAYKNTWYQSLRNFTNILLLFLLTMTGHYGGNLTHGSTFLVEYAPEPLRKMAGLDARRPVVTELAQADPWFDVVSPMLQARCSTCHNDDKQNGQLNLKTIDSLLVGGEGGAVVIPGNADSSELYLRITLPEKHDGFMPAEGKTPLTSAQRDIIYWWITSDMPMNITLGEMNYEDKIEPLLIAELGLNSNQESSLEMLPILTAETMTALVDNGFLVRSVSQDSNGLIVSVYSKGLPVTRQMMDVLYEAKASIVDMNLSNGGVSDNLLNQLNEFSALQKLNLANNNISDKTLSDFSQNTALEVLNLYGNPEISDLGVEFLSSNQQLKSLYIWGTSISENGIKILSEILPELTIQGQTKLQFTPSE